MTIERIKSIAAVISMEAGVEYFPVASILGIFRIFDIQYLVFHAPVAQRYLVTL